VNLVLALLWLMLGVTVLAWQTFTGNSVMYLPVGDYRISYGWLMLLLVAYNLRRWWSVRAVHRQRRQTKTGIVSALHRREKTSPVPPAPPNPELDFSEPPPPITPG
jgi:hypothetical protein